jgi:serine/threonine protein phosphatase PrpC
MKTFSVFSTPGLRSQNEDAIFAKDSVFIIADGLGGHSDGKIASEMAVQSLSQTLCREDPAVFVLGGQHMEEGELMEAFLMDAVRQAGALVAQEARTRGSDMATTVTAVILKGEMGYCAHVGDCALFVSQGGDLPPSRLTTEHRRGASLYRTLGGTDQVTPDILAFQAKSQGLFLLGCDGFWEHISDTELKIIIEDTPDYLLAERLGDSALKNGSSDNVSVVAVVGEAFSARNAAHQVDCERTRLDGLPSSPEKTTLMDTLRVFASKHKVPFTNPLEEENQALRLENQALLAENQSIKSENSQIQNQMAGLILEIESLQREAQILTERAKNSSTSYWKLRDVTLQLFSHIHNLLNLYPRELVRTISTPELERLNSIYQLLVKQKPPEK